MTITEILEKAKTLTAEEREALIQHLVAMRKPETVAQISAEHWTQAELDELLTIEPMTGREIVAAGLTGGWRDLNIQDGAAWVEAQRRKRRERRQW
jgi:hypothetical protein